MLASLAAPRAAYVHVPFCAHHCGYCNFTVVAGRDDLADRYLAAIQRELESLIEPREVDTLFLGGGTPTHLPDAELRRLLALVRQWFPLAAGHEFTVEANPIDVDRRLVATLAEYGVNRISLGAQSFAADKLRLLERDHTRDDIVRAVGLARDGIRGGFARSDLRRPRRNARCVAGRSSRRRSSSRPITCRLTA